MSTASATSGTVTGTFQFLQRQENCGVGTGVKYPCTQYNQNRPVRGAYVRVSRVSNDQSNGQELGYGYTNSSGAFTVNWTDGSSSTANVTIKVTWHADHQDGRFRIVGSSGGTYAFWISNGSGGEQTYIGKHNDNVAVGTKNWGNNPHANTYDGARMLWESIKVSNRLNTYFGNGTPKCPTGLTLCTSRTKVAINNTGTGNANFSGCTATNAWADPWDNYVCLSNDNWGRYSNLSRVMHEMGHIAEYVSNRDQRRYWVADYRRDDPAACSGPTPPANCNTHSLNSAEWHSPQYQESIASHFAHVALYTQAASQPFTCVGLASCDTIAAPNGYNIEARPTTCNTEHRWEVTAMRFWWDTYDSTSDSQGGNTDNLARNIWEVADTVHAFDPGFGNNARDEVWSSSTSGPDDPDGHSHGDHVTNWAVWGTNATAVLNLNCSPQGSD